MELTIPQATYFQVVFTLPASLSSLALGNRNEIYNLLFETAWASLRTKMEKDLGIQAAGVAVLHTWNQRLGHHPHVHMMVPGNGPSLDGQRWVECRMEWCRKTKQMKPFLVLPTAVLGAMIATPADLFSILLAMAFALPCYLCGVVWALIENLVAVLAARNTGVARAFAQNELFMTS
jgi:hypothetical protein